MHGVVVESDTSLLYGIPAESAISLIKKIYEPNCRFGYIATETNYNPNTTPHIRALAHINTS